ncbi:MAG TPA: sugar phosphate nucleotidyltransferase [Rhizomicrobium sp.]|jgi:mannose-1-phosphate guanylyltransferase|nr:sugar phosphate nucleotidyltransferase [Rhizomicrobium sp.]
MRAFILCGGDGTRLAPLPAKQFLALTGPQTLIQQTMRRAARYEPVTVITNAAQAGLVAAQLPGTNVILETVRRGTATAAALAAEAEPGLILLLPADHVIANEAAFHRAVAAAAPLAEAGRIVTFGIPAAWPETGYGYIAHAGTDVTRFVEKPPREQAQVLIAQGALWNSGMFLFRGDVMREELARFGREGSLDHAVMEKTDRAAVVPCEIGWSDIGSWQSLWRFTQSRTDLAGATVVRPWGRYTSFAHGEGFQLKELVVDPGKRISLQRHKHRREYWTVVAGRALVTRDKDVFALGIGEHAGIPLGALHRLENPGAEPLHIIEVQFGDYLGEDDIERFSDDFGRA